MFWCEFSDDLLNFRTHHRVHDIWVSSLYYNQKKRKKMKWTEYYFVGVCYWQLHFPLAWVLNSKFTWMKEYKIAALIFGWLGFDLCIQWNHRRHKIHNSFKDSDYFTLDRFSSIQFEDLSSSVHLSSISVEVEAEVICRFLATKNSVY